MAKKKKERILTPKGVASFPWVRKADTKFSKKGVFKCGVTLDKSDTGVEEFIAALEAQRDEVVQELKDGNFQWLGETVKLKPYQIKELNIHPVCTFVRDDETGEPTGEVTINAKQNAIYGKNDEYKAKITVVNSKGEPDASLNVFGGDSVKMCFTTDGFWNAKDQLIGLTLRLVAVQVIESNGGSGNADYGFGDEGDGAVGSGEGFGDESNGDDTDDASTDESEGDF